MSGYWRREAALALHRTQLLLLHEVRAALRDPRWRAVVGGTAVLTACLALLPVPTPATAAVVGTAVLTRLLTAGLLVWAAAVAARDRRDTVLRSRATGPLYVAVVWAGSLAAVLVASAGLALLLSLLLAPWTGAAAPGFFLHVFLRCAATAAGGATLGFAAGRLSGTALAAVPLAAAWLLAGTVPALAPLRPDLVERLPALWTLALCGMCAVFYRERPAPAAAWAPGRAAAAGGAALVIALVLLLGGQQAARSGPAEQPFVDAGPATLGERLPGFWQRSTGGDWVRTGAFEGKLLAVALVEPGDPLTGEALGALARLQRENAARGLQVLAVSLCTDPADGAVLGRLGLPFPVLTDRATVTADGLDSEFTRAFRAHSLPLVVFTDRRTRLVDFSLIPDYRSLAERVRERLSEEAQ